MEQVQRQLLSFGPYVLCTVFLVLLILEKRCPLRRMNFSLRHRWLTNVAITAIVFALGGLLVRPIVTTLMELTETRAFGALQFVELPHWADTILGFLLLDITYYYWHRLNHRFMPLWRFHNVHHLDPDMDVTTSFRFHYGEIVFSIGFRVLQVGLTGVSLSTYLVYETVSQLNTMFHHSNLRLPLAFERLLNLVLVTPRMHGVHHSNIRDEMDSNYSVVFRWWDALHGTLRLNVPQQEIEIGVAAYHAEEDNALPNVLAIPFRSQREFWRAPDGRDLRHRDGEPSGVGPMAG